MKTIITLLFLFIVPCYARVYTVAVVGKTGVGKSSLINSLFGEDIAPVGHTLEATTGDVYKYPMKFGEDTLHIWDTMGLNDEKGDPKEYISRIANNIEKSHLILFCLDTTELRWTKENTKLLELFKNELDESIFKNTLFVFTKFNVYSNLKNIKHLKYKISSIIPNAEFGIAENKKTKEWKNKLWTKIKSKCKPNILPVFVKVIFKRNKICEISRNATRNIKENDVYPIYMGKKREKKLKDCMAGVETFNDRINTMSYLGSAGIFVNAGPVLKVSKFVAGTLGIGGGMYIKNILSQFHRNSSYCDSNNDLLNIDSYKDTYEWTGGTYKGDFKRNLFHGYGEMWDDENNSLFKGNFKNGIPDIPECR